MKTTPAVRELSSRHELFHRSSINNFGSVSASSVLSGAPLTVRLFLSLSLPRPLPPPAADRLCARDGPVPMMIRCPCSMMFRKQGARKQVGADLSYRATPAALRPEPPPPNWRMEVDSTERASQGAVDPPPRRAPPGAQKKARAEKEAFNQTDKNFLCSNTITSSKI